MTIDFDLYLLIGLLVVALMWITMAPENRTEIHVELEDMLWRFGPAVVALTLTVCVAITVALWPLAAAVRLYQRFRRTNL